MSGLYVDSVRKEFGTNTILSDIFLTCNVGEIVGLLGRNGSGKSTLLKIIFGVTAADQKFIKVDDKKIDSLFDSRNLIKYLPQHGFMPTHIKVKDLIKLSCEKERIAEVKGLEFIKPHLDKKSRDLSGGERRIIEVLLMLYSKTKYLLFDEPFSALDPIYVQLLINIIKEHSATKGILITDHNFRHILTISTRLTLLKDGALVQINHEDELVDQAYISGN